MLSCQKNLFNLDPDIHYLNCARMSPLLSQSEDAALKALIRERNPHLISINDFFDEVNEVRSLYAELIHAEQEQIVTLPSTSYGFATALSNISLRAGRKALTVQDIFPSAYFSIKRWCDDGDHELIVADPPKDTMKLGKSWNEKILSILQNEDVGVVIMPLVHWMTGTIFDMEAIGNYCHEHDIMLIVDGTQSVGMKPVDVKQYHIDVLICATYKWLYGPYGIALGYFSAQFNHGRPLEEAWTNRSNAKAFHKLTEYEDQYIAGARRYNTGQSSNFILMPILKHSLKQILDWRPEEMYDYVKHLKRPLDDYLSKKGIATDEDEYIAHHLFSIKLPSSVDHETLSSSFKEDGVSISFRGDYIRVSLNVYNDEADVQAMINAIDKAFVHQ